VGERLRGVRPATGHRITAGLNSDLSASTYWSMDYAFSIWPSGSFEIRERGVYRKEGSFSARSFRISIDGAVVVYGLNGTPVAHQHGRARVPHGAGRDAVVGGRLALRKHGRRGADSPPGIPGKVAIGRR
jgi:hypothetical protein